MRHGRFLHRGLVLVALLVAGLLSGPVTGNAEQGRRSYIGTIDCV